MKLSYVGVDLAKNVFQLHGVDRHGQAVWRRRLRRGQWLQVLLDTVEPGCVIGMEACGGAHHWARRLQAHGYAVRLIAPQFVKPYVKSNKNDLVDAEAICEAMSRPGMRFVALKSAAQQDIQAMHRIRAELVGQRTAKANQIRGLAGEYGIVAPRGLHQLRRAVPCWLEDAENGLSERFRGLLAELHRDLRYLDERVGALDTLIARSVQQDPLARRLLAVRGIGTLTASALAGALGDGSGFRKGREFAASLGLTPRQHSSGGRERLLGISKRGDPYLRTLLVHGARTVLHRAKGRDDGLSQWLNGLAARKHTHVAAVALANKTARIAWAVAAGGRGYEPARAAGAHAASP